MGLSDRQIEQWETLAKRGVLNGDSAVSSVMSGLRMAMLTSVELADGTRFSLFNIRGNNNEAAITTTSANFGKSGLLELNEQALMEAIERNPDDIMRLFTASDGLMAKLDEQLNNAVSTSIIDNRGTPRGRLIQRAGTATGMSSTNNVIFHRIKSLNDSFTILQGRYERQQDRFWRQFTAMEKQFAALNSQSNHITNMFGHMWNNN
jgi:flagellar hook-associated protein 2